MPANGRPFPVRQPISRNMQSIMETAQQNEPQEMETHCKSKFLGLTSSTAVFSLGKNNFNII